MGIFSRTRDVIDSNLGALLNKADDPEKMARLTIGVRGNKVETLFFDAPDADTVTTEGISHPAQRQGDSRSCWYRANRQPDGCRWWRGYRM